MEENMILATIKEYINQNFVVECFDTRNSCNRYMADDFIISFIKK